MREEDKGSEGPPGHLGPRLQTAGGHQSFALKGPWETWVVPGPSLSYLLKRLPPVHCASVEPSGEAGPRGEVAAFFFNPFSPKQFSEQAFVSLRRFCFCSGLILPIYPSSGTCLLCPASLWDARAQQIGPRLILSALKQTQSYLGLVI